MGNGRKWGNMAIEEISRIPVGDMILRYEQETDYAMAGFSVIPHNWESSNLLCKHVN